MVPHFTVRFDWVVKYQFLDFHLLGHTSGQRPKVTAPHLIGPFEGFHHFWCLETKIKLEKRPNEKAYFEPRPVAGTWPEFCHDQLPKPLLHNCQTVRCIRGHSV